jgi:hypothetical protein
MGTVESLWPSLAVLLPVINFLEALDSLGFIIENLKYG